MISIRRWRLERHTKAAAQAAAAHRWYALEHCVLAQLPSPTEPGIRLAELVIVAGLGPAIVKEILTELHNRQFIDVALRQGATDPNDPRNWRLYYRVDGALYLHRTEGRW